MTGDCETSDDERKASVLARLEDSGLIPGKEILIDLSWSLDGVIN